MSDDTGPNLPPFPSSYRASGPTALATWDQERSRGSINFAMQDKAGGRHCPWARRVTATRLINRCRRSPATAF